MDLVRKNADTNLDSTVRNNLAELIDVSGVPAGFSCVQTMINNVVACADQRTRSRRNNIYWDDALAYCLANPVFGDLAGAGLSVHRAHTVPLAERNLIISQRNAYCAKKSSIHPDFGAGNSNFTSAFQCVQGNYYLDRNCNRVLLGLDGLPLDPNLRACGGASVSFYGSSPLSLVWEPGADANLTVSVVRFPLDMSKQGHFYTWRGSSSLPLVVYDPAHTGRITDATQLLGNWSFGGTQVASLGTDQFPLTPPWKDGYEALAQLDTDHDGRVSGSELAPLGLWFDHNSNGISEPGEVKPITEAGVTALYYASDSYDEGTKTVRASRGYERAVDGRVIHGVSIDWFGGVAPTASSLIDGYLKEGKVGPVSDSSGHKADKVSEQAASVANQETPWNGVWEWRLKGSEAQPIPDGYLFMGNHEGGVRGISLTPSYVQPAVGDLAVALSMFDFTGRFAGEGADQKLAFRIEHGDSVLKTSVAITPKGDELHGTTEIVGRAPGVGKNMRYEWIGRRRQ